MSNSKQMESNSENKGGIPNAAYLLTGCIGVIGANSLVLGPIAPEVAQSLQVNVSQIMLAASAFGLGTALSALFLAHHIDRLGAFKVLRMSMMLLALAMFASSISPVVSALIIAQLIVGLAAGIALPAIYANAITVAPKGQESKVLSVVLTGWTISMIAGVSLSVVLSGFLGWRSVYATISLLALLAWVGLTRLNIADSITEDSPPMPLTALTLPGIKPLLICCFAFMAAFYGMYGFIGDYLHRVLELPLLANSLIALVYGLGFGCAIFLNPLVKKVEIKRLFFITLIFVAALYLVMALLGQYVSAVFGVLFVLGLANHFAVNLLIMRLTDVDNTKRGTIMGLYSTVTYIGVFIGTSIYGQIYLHFGFSMLAYTSMALTIFAIVAGFWKSNTKRRLVSLISG